MPSHPAPTPATDPVGLNNRLGLIYMIAGMALFASVDTVAKVLTESLHPIQIAWTRQMGLGVGAVLLIAWRGFAVLRTRHPVLQIARGVTAAGSASFFIAAVMFVPLADASAVGFVAPFMVTVMAAVLLKEPVGARRWAAVIIGFVGAMIIVRPGLGVFHPAILLVLVAAFMFAIRQILSRKLAGIDPITTTFTYTALGGIAVLTVLLPLVWQWPQGGTVLVLCFVIAALAAVAEIMVIKALEIAHAVAVAPVVYTLLIWSTLYGYLVFADLPDMWTWVGAAVIVVTGLYTVHRERVVQRRRDTDQPT